MIDDQLYVYEVKDVLRVIDGDSYEIVIDLGFNALLRIRARLLGADTFEMRGGTETTKQLARDGQKFAEMWLSDGPIFCRTHSVDSFGRWLAEFWNGEGEHLAARLIEAGFTTGRYEEEER